eukprot:TRINITY_DN13674_c0_g1_i1.p2 TRINITY_DN13674_c0_g1~~TRINITY_DN13674_c0_g1_i1.p2  ORF type:complete len:175 (+),score=35.03 TRINITY_DN13674_c0_g1_i1:33-527(+)
MAKVLESLDDYLRLQFELNTNATPGDYDYAHQFARVFDSMTPGSVLYFPVNCLTFPSSPANITVGDGLPGFIAAKAKIMRDLKTDDVCEKVFNNVCLTGPCVNVTVVAIRLPADYDWKTDYAFHEPTAADCTTDDVNNGFNPVLGALNLGDEGPRTCVLIVTKY